MPSSVGEHNKGCHFSGENSFPAFFSLFYTCAKQRQQGNSLGRGKDSARHNLLPQPRGHENLIFDGCWLAKTTANDKVCYQHYVNLYFSLLSEKYESCGGCGFHRSQVHSYIQPKRPQLIATRRAQWYYSLARGGVPLRSLRSTFQRCSLSLWVR